MRARRNCWSALSARTSAHIYSAKVRVGGRCISELPNECFMRHRNNMRVCISLSTCTVSSDFKGRGGQLITCWKNLVLHAGNTAHLAPRRPLSSFNYLYTLSVCLLYTFIEAILLPCVTLSAHHIYCCNINAWIDLLRKTSTRGSQCWEIKVQPVRKKHCKKCPCLINTQWVFCANH